MRGVYSRAKRAVWAFIVADERNSRLGKYATMSEPYPSSLRSELRALAEILRHTAGNLVIHVDNKQVVDGVQAGARRCCSATLKGADIWREVWRSLNDSTNV